MIINKLLFALGLLALLCCATVGAQAPVASFFQHPAATDAKLSPSGRHVAIASAAPETGRIGVYVLDLQTSPPTAVPVAAFGDFDIRSFHWVDDEYLVFDVVDLRSGSGNDYFFPQGLYSVRHDGQQLRQLVAHNVPFTTSRLIRVLPLAWNHQLLHVPRGAGTGSEVIVGELLFDVNELRSVRPLWLDVRSGRSRRYEVDKLPANVHHWWFSERGALRAALSRDKGREHLHWYREGSEGKAGEWQMLAEAAWGSLSYLPVWVGDGEQMLVSSHVGARRESVISSFDFATGQPAGKPLLQVPGFDFAGRLISEGGRLIGAQVHADTEQSIWLDPARKALQDMIDETLPGRVNRIDCRRCAADDALVLVDSYSDQHPGELLLYRKGAAQPWQRIRSRMAGIDARQMATTDLHRIKARDGLEIPVWITQSPTAAKKARPAVVLVHGGPWVRGRYWNWDAMAQFLASRGYVVIEPEFRGSDGYGRTHELAGHRQWGQAMQNDVADALRWAQSQGLASDQACIAGASYGGYSSLMGLVNDPQLYRCGIAWVAVTDPFLYLQGSWRAPDDISGVGRSYLLPEWVGDVQKDRDMLLAHSPVAQAARIKAPLLLAYGDNDRRVPLAHGERLRSAMRKAGNDPEWVVYAEEGHGWRQEKNRIDFGRRVEAFLAKHLPVR